MTSFQHASTPERLSAGHFTWTADQSWFQGRGIYGGLTFATLVRAIELSTTLPLRRLSVELCAPISDQPCDIRIGQARRGASTEFLTIELKQSEQMMLIGTAVCAVNRDQSIDRSPSHPLPSPNVPPLSANPLMPPFSQHFEYRPTTGELPMSGQTTDRLRTGGWIQARTGTKRDSALVLGLIDAWWPALFLAVNRPRAMGTISFAVELLNQPTAQCGAFYIESQTEHCVGGYALEENRLWDHNGALLAQAQQRVALIR